MFKPSVPRINVKISKDHNSVFNRFCELLGILVYHIIMGYEPYDYIFQYHCYMIPSSTVALVKRTNTIIL